MLVLTSQIGERLQIGEHVAVTLKQTARGKCKLFIEAPRDVAVWRGEIWDRLQQERREQPAAG